MITLNANKVFYQTSIFSLDLFPCILRLASSLSFGGSVRVCHTRTLNNNKEILLLYIKTYSNKCSDYETLYVMILVYLYRNNVKHSKPFLVHTKK